MGQFGIGQGIKRFEDVRLVRGEGRFHADVNLPGQTHAVIVRSMHAHARIRGIDAAAALRAPGVLAVFTGADVARDGLGTMTMTLKRKRPDGSPMFASPQRGLAPDRGRYVGDPIAMVIAETRAQAEDAADLVQVDYEPLPSVTSTAAAAEAGSPVVWDECPDNISNLFEAGDKAATDAAFAKAARIVRRRYVITRVHAQYIEARGALGVYDRGEDRYTLYADVQYPHRVRNALATNILKVPEHQIRVIAGDIGGAFGTKGWQYAEHRLVLWAARKLGRPVKWMCERREAIPADEHARDNVTDAELALDADGRFIGLRVRTLANVGAYVSSDRNLLATFSNVTTLVGVYTFPAAYVQVLSVMTNTNSTAPYRGAGRPESTYVIERLIDDAGRELGVDRIELRRRNIVPSGAMPYRTPLGGHYDCGAFDKNMEEALKLADVAGFPARREAARKRGVLRGLAVVNAIEKAAGPQLEFAEIRFAPSGSATLLMGSKNQGQGHETTFKQILHERLGLDPADVRYIDGDTERVGFGMGTMGSRSTVIGGTALWTAADTGAVTLVSYVIVDYVGTVNNPVTLKGQIHGGVAQGVGQALMEQVVYDAESGQLLTASFMDYAIPRADTLPDMHIESNPVPTKLNPLGAKGAGEAGTVGALPAVMNAVMGALAAVGVRELDMPAGAERVWRAIHALAPRSS